MKNVSRLLMAVSLLFLCIIAPESASAHRLNVFAWLENNKILVECNFGENRPAANATVTVLDDSNQKELLRGKTDANGKFAFAVSDVVRHGHGLVISASAGQGHMGKWTMDAQELNADQYKAKEREHLQATPIQSETAAPHGSQVSDEQLRLLINAALDQHLGPISRQLAAQAAKGPSIAEIIGGIGWIMGFAGIALYFKSRKA